jgi:2-phospho-L-lactate/phosphoenolpyruvate guanylyltransferase
MSMAKEIWAVVAAKGFDGAKSRLSPSFAPAFRRELARLMLEDVLETLSAVRGLGGTLVVTDNPEVEEIAGRYPVEIFAHPAQGHTAVVTAAAAELARRGHGMLALPADIPGATVEEIERVLAAAPEEPGLVIVPARDLFGSNAILAVPADVIPLAFGADSFVRHRKIAREHGIEPRVLASPGIELDIDEPADLLRFFRRPSPTRAWRFLEAQGTGAPVCETAQP